MIRTIAVASAVTAVALLQGCASTQQFVPQADIARPDPSKAVIQVVRTSSALGSGRAVQVEDNGKPVGEVASGDSLTWAREPGRMRLSLTTSFGVVRPDSPPLEDTVRAGQVYRYALEWSWGANSFVLKIGVASP